MMRRRFAKKPTEGPGRGKRYPTTTFARSIEFERLLKPIKGVYPAGVEGDFSGFEGGTANARIIRI
jgi:hypothetical protein